MGIKQDFGLRLKELRTKQGITQSQLTEMAGIDAKHLSHIETGRSFPKADLIENFAKSLNIHYTELFKTKHFISRQTIIKNTEKIVSNANDNDLTVLYKLILSYIN